MPQPKDGGPRKMYPKNLVCIYCRRDEHSKCPGCDCSQVKHQIELVLEDAA